jgi:hypothetical protein
VIVLINDDRRNVTREWVNFEFVELGFLFCVLASRVNNNPLKATQKLDAIFD